MLTAELPVGVVGAEVRQQVRPLAERLLTARRRTGERTLVRVYAHVNLTAAEQQSNTGQGRARHLAGSGARKPGDIGGERNSTKTYTTHTKRENAITKTNEKIILAVGTYYQKSTVG